MLGCWGQMHEHAAHVRSTRSLVPPYQSFDPSRRGDMPAELGETWRVFGQRLGPWGGSLVVVSSVKLLALLALIGMALRGELVGA